MHKPFLERVKHEVYGTPAKKNQKAEIYLIVSKYILNTVTSKQPEMSTSSAVLNHLGNHWAVIEDEVIFYIQ